MEIQYEINNKYYSTEFEVNELEPHKAIILGKELNNEIGSAILIANYDMGVINCTVYGLNSDGTVTEDNWDVKELALTLYENLSLDDIIISNSKLEIVIHSIDTTIEGDLEPRHTYIENDNTVISCAMLTTNKNLVANPEEPVEPRLPTQIKFEVQEPKLYLRESVGLYGIKSMLYSLDSISSESEFVSWMGDAAIAIADYQINSLLENLLNPGVAWPNNWRPTGSVPNSYVHTYIMSTVGMPDLITHSSELKTKPGPYGGTVNYIEWTEMLMGDITSASFPDYFISLYFAVVGYFEETIPNYERKSLMELIKGTKQEIPSNFDVTDFHENMALRIQGDKNDKHAPAVYVTVGSAMLIDATVTFNNRDTSGSKMKGKHADSYAYSVSEGYTYAPSTSTDNFRVSYVKAITREYSDSRFSHDNEVVYIDYGLANTEHNLGVV